MRRCTSQSVSTSYYGWGLPRRVSKSTRVGRIEFSRRGAKLDSETAVFELPDVYVKYVRHFAQWRALDRVGPGQDAELAKHFRLRFDVGVARIKKRMTAICTHRTGAFGGKQMVRTRPPRPRLPWQYGRTVR